MAAKYGTVLIFDVTWYCCDVGFDFGFGETVSNFAAAKYGTVSIFDVTW